MKAEEVYDMLMEAFEEGIDADKMTLELDSETYYNLKNHTMTVRANRPRHYELERISGVEVNYSSEVRLIKDMTCSECDSDKMYHDKERFWVCPFCEL